MRRVKQALWEVKYTWLLRSMCVYYYCVLFCKEMGPILRRDLCFVLQVGENGALQRW